MECVQDGESKIQDHMPKWLFDPWVWMWWNSISNISRHWDQNDQNIIQLKSKEIPHTAVIPTAVLFDCQTVHIWDIIKWTLHEKKRFVACIMFALPQPLDIELCDVNYSVIFHIVAFQAWKWEVGYIVNTSNISWMPKCSTDDPTVFSTSTINMVHLVHLLLIGICLQVIFLPLPQKSIRNKLKQGNGSATFVSSQNSKALAGEPPAPTRTSSTTATTPEAFNSDLVKTDNSETSSEKHEGSPSQSENDEVKKSTAPTRVPIWGPGFLWGPFSVFGSPKGPHFHYFRAQT